jgi:hypothetical protein
MEDIYSNYKNKELRKTFSTPLISINGTGRRPPLCLNFDLNKSNPLFPPEYYKMKKMEEHLIRLEKENIKQEEQIKALMSYQYNMNKKRFNADGNITCYYINPPLYYINDLDNYYSINKILEESEYNMRAKTERDRRIIKKYGQKIHNLKKLLKKENLRKKINKSIYDNYHLNIRKDINNFMNVINKSFQNRLESDIILNSNINKIQKKYGKIKKILKDKITNLEYRQKKGFNDIKNEMLNQIQNMQEIEAIKNSRIKKELDAKIKIQTKIENIKRQKEIEQLRRNQQIESFENNKLRDEIKFNKLKREMLNQKNKVQKMANVFQRYKYSIPYMYLNSYK